MKETKIEPPRVEKKPYSPPAIVFEHPTEALASACNGTDNCPSKQSSGACDSFDSCQTTPNS